MNSLKTYLMVLAVAAMGCGTKTDAGSHCNVNADCDPGCPASPTIFRMPMDSARPPAPASAPSNVSPTMSGRERLPTAANNAAARRLARS